MKLPMKDSTDVVDESHVVDTPTFETGHALVHDGVHRCIPPVVEKTKPVGPTVEGIGLVGGHHDGVPGVQRLAAQGDLAVQQVIRQLSQVESAKNRVSRTSSLSA
jgi:hypothetical protein